LDSAKYFWDIIQNGLYPDHPKLKMYQPLLAKSYLLKAKDVGVTNPVAGIREMQKGISEDSTNAELWYNLGGAYYVIKRFDSARYAWVMTLQLKPSDEIANNAKNGLNAISSM